MKLTSLFMAVVFAVFGCAGLTVQYPDTPIGQATFFAGSYHKLVDQYVLEKSWATNPGHVEMLKYRRSALVHTDLSIRIIINAARDGIPITASMISTANAAMNEIKQYMYAKQGVGPSKLEIANMMNEANLVSEYQSQGFSTVFLGLVELIQAMLPLLQQLQDQARMTLEELRARFDLEYNWMSTFDPTTLP